MKSRRNFSVNVEKIEALAATVREVVAAYSRIGCKVEHAQEQAAGDLGLSARRVKALVYNEVFLMTPAEADRIEQGFAAHLEAEAARFVARAKQARARRDAMRSPEPVASVTALRVAR